MQLFAGKVYWHDKLKSQRILVVLSGQDKAAIRRAGATDQWLTAWINKMDHRVTRLDVALDLHNWDAKPSEVYQWWQDGTLETPAQRVAEYHDLRKVGDELIDSSTVYIGSSASLRQIRIYNKAAEQGVDGDWIRIEMILRGDQARAVVEGSRHVPLYDILRAKIRDFALCRSTWLDRATTGIAIALLPVKRKPGNREKWLLTVVLKSLENELTIQEAQGYREVWDAFATLLGKFAD
jgi:hypothetical protein